MKKLVLLCALMIVFDARAQNYIKRTADEPVYDVEVIVFGRHLAQPPADSVQLADVYDQQAAAMVDFLPPEGDWPIIKTPPEKTSDPAPANTDDNKAQKPEDNDQWQIPLDEEPIDYEVLVWFLKSKQLMGPVINLLDDNPKYKPLVRQVWRQPATPFTEPLYVRVNNHQPETELIPEDTSPLSTETSDFSFHQKPQPATDDFQISGQVALSQGRFTHLHIRFNYYRINEDNEVLVYGTKQQRQINIGEWQYFDHPQFGVLIKVTAVNAEELL